MNQPRKVKARLRRYAVCRAIGRSIRNSVSRLLRCMAFIIELPYKYLLTRLVLAISVMLLSFEIEPTLNELGGALALVFGFTALPFFLSLLVATIRWLAPSVRPPATVPYVAPSRTRCKGAKSLHKAKTKLHPAVKHWLETSQITAPQEG